MVNLTFFRDSKLAVGMLHKGAQCSDKNSMLFWVILIFSDGRLRRVHVTYFMNTTVATLYKKLLQCRQFLFRQADALLEYVN